MKYTKQEVMQFVAEEDVKFIRLAFCDVFGNQKNISIMPNELERAFEQGIAIDASAVEGFGDEVDSDLFLHPDPDTLTILPWRPEHGRVIRMFSEITYPSGKVFENDSRSILKKAIEKAEHLGYRFYFGAEMEFYLFKLDENGEQTKVPYDTAGYMDIAPKDKGENVRREICLTLEQMEIYPESSHHEEGPGQNEIDFRYSDALSAADNTIAFASVVRTIAARNGLYASFTPKPLEDKVGNGLHINMSIKAKNGSDPMDSVIAGILEKITEITAFLNPTEESYKRLGKNKAPKFISWSSQNRSQLIRVPAAEGKIKRFELRSPDPSANPYLAFALLIYAGLYGIEHNIPLPPATDINLYKANNEIIENQKLLPQSKAEAIKHALSSDFVTKHLPQQIIKIYCK